MKRCILAATVLLASCSSAFAAPVPVSSCGQTIFEGALTGDLDCSSTPVPSVVIQDGGTLDLAGFLLTSGNATAILCQGACTVLAGSLLNGEAASYPTVYGVLGPVRGNRSPVVLHDVNFTGFVMAASAGRLSMEGGVVTGGRNGVSARRLSVHGAEFHHIEYDAVTAWIGDLVDTSVHDIGTGGVRLVQRGTVQGSSLVANGSYGLLGGKLHAVDSTIDGNCVNPGTGDFPCADIMALYLRKPSVLENTTCSTSLMGSGHPLSYTTMGICSLD